MTINNNNEGMPNPEAQASVAPAVNPRKNTSLLYEEGMSVKDYIIRKKFYTGSCNPRTFQSKDEENTYYSTDYMWNYILMNPKEFKIQDEDRYHFCSDELLEYSLKGLESIKID